MLEALLAQIDVPLPESVVEAEVQWRRRATDDQLTRGGLTMEGYLESEGKTAEEFETEVLDRRERGRQGAARARRRRRRRAARGHRRRAQRPGRPPRAALRISPDEFAQQLVNNGQLPLLVQEVRRGKALATVMEAATIVDAAGTPVDLEALSDEVGPGGTDVEVDEDGRRFHVHADGAVHYLDEE